MPIKHLRLACLSFALAGPVAVIAQDLKHPDWHPDGVTLISEGSCEGGIDLYLINTDSGDVQRLHDGEHTEGYPRWFNDGRRIAFHEIDDERNARIFTAIVSNARIESLKPMSNGPFDIEPAPSPDGRAIAFSRPGDNGLNIAILDVASRKIVNIWPADPGEHFPSWRADGTAVLFHAPTADNVQILQRSVESAVTTQLTRSGGPNMTGHFNHDASQLVFSSERTDDREIYLLTLASGAETRLTSSVGRDGYPKFSPDGSKVAYHSSSPDQPSSIKVLELQSKNTTEFSCYPLN